MASLNLPAISVTQLLLYFLPIARILYTFSLSIYRLYFHPLSHFPGSKLTALTLWYEFYHDVVRRGKFTFEIARMHEQHGPIVRINPHELHISDPDFYDTLYVSAAVRRTDKYWWSARMFGNPGSMISSVGHDLHRMRRQPLNAFFSKAAVARLEPMIERKIGKMCGHLERARETGEVVQLGLLFVSLATDDISEYCFGQAYGFLDSERGVAAAANFSSLQRHVLKQTLLQRHFGWFLPLIVSIPDWLVVALKPEMKGFLTYRAHTREQILKVMADKDAGEQAEKQQITEKPKLVSRTIFQDLLARDIPASEKTLVRIEEEAQTIVAAGADTTAHMLEVTAFHLLANPPILHRLLKELKTTMPDEYTLPSVNELAHLPYFAAVINEGFRLSGGISSRLTRVSPDKALQCQEWTIPAGTPVSMTTHIQHADPDLFPDPKTFYPDRFLNEGKKLMRYLTNFSKGTRNCLGMNLARAEIYCVLAIMLVRFGAEMKLLETDRSDIDLAHDFFGPYPRLDSEGLRVVVTTKRDT